MIVTLVKKTHSDRRGQAMVEFAMTLPLLALLLFAIIQYGFLFAAQITVRNASAVGARHMVLDRNVTFAAAESFARQSVAPMLDPTLATATAANVTVDGKTAKSMTVSYQLQLIIPFVVPGGSNPRTLTATTIMR